MQEITVSKRGILSADKDAHVIEVNISVLGHVYMRSYHAAHKPSLADLQRELDAMLKVISDDIIEDYRNG